MFSDYQQFVLSKAAPPYPINEYKFQLLHAALGLATEHLELMNYKDEANQIEECEDLLWYMMLAAHAVGFKVDNLPESVSSLSQPERNLVDKLEEFISLVKKHCIYCKDKNDDLYTSFFAAWRAFVAYCEFFGLSLDKLMEGNREKLNKRYAAAFTTEESETRRDKQEVLLDDPAEKPTRPERVKEILDSILKPEDTNRG